MAAEVGQIFVDSKTVSANGTAEVITTRDIACTSVFLLPKSGNTNNVYLVDFTTETKKLIIPTSGLTLPISNPALIKIDVDTNDEGLDWVAV